MCDQYDNRGCEVVEEKDDMITNLEDEIDYLRSRLFDKENKIDELESKLYALSSINVKYPEVL